MLLRPVFPSVSHEMDDRNTNLKAIILKGSKKQPKGTIDRYTHTLSVHTGKGLYLVE